MNPLLLPIILIIYAELSTFSNTREISRICLYTYLLSLLSTMYIPDYKSAVVVSMVILLAGQLYSCVMAETLLGKCVFALVIVVSLYVHTGLLLQYFEMDIYLYGNSLLGNSDYLYREMTLLAIGLSAKQKMDDITHMLNHKENKINLIVITLWWLF